jgi:hypothetical protein
VSSTIVTRLKVPALYAVTTSTWSPTATAAGRASDAGICTVVIAPALTATTMDVGPTEESTPWRSMKLA